MNINDFIRDLMDIGLYSGVIDAKSTSDASGQMHLIQWLANMSKLKKLESKIGQIHG